MKLYMPGDWCLKKGRIFNYHRIYRMRWDKRVGVVRPLPEPFVTVKFRKGIFKWTKKEK